MSSDDPIRYADAVVVAPDGTIYVTDASTRFAPGVGQHARSTSWNNPQPAVLAYECA